MSVVNCAKVSSLRPDRHWFYEAVFVTPQGRIETSAFQRRHEQRTETDCTPSDLPDQELTDTDRRMLDLLDGVSASAARSGTGGAGPNTAAANSAFIAGFANSASVARALTSPVQMVDRRVLGEHVLSQPPLDVFDDITEILNAI